MASNELGVMYFARGIMVDVKTEGTEYLMTFFVLDAESKWLDTIALLSCTKWWEGHVLLSPDLSINCHVLQAHYL